MNVNGLIHWFEQPHDEAFKLNGSYGLIQCVPEHHDNGPDTYHIDCCFKGSTKEELEQHADGLRCSTACCLSACIIFGEKAVTENSMIDAINHKLP